MHLHSKLCVCVQSSDSHWLSPADRDQLMIQLRATGWVEVENRDAIFKELHFKTFNQVCVFLCRHILCHFHQGSDWLKTHRDEHTTQ